MTVPRALAALVWCLASGSAAALSDFIFADGFDPVADAGLCFSDGGCEHGHCISNVCCATACNDNDACTADTCPGGVCRSVDLSRCSLPGAEAQCKLSTSCGTLDDDGDGLAQAWEAQGGIDYDCDGVLGADETVLSNVDPLFPDGSANATPSADPGVADVFVKYDWMALPDQGGACTVNPLPFPNNLFYPLHSDACAWDQLCLGGTCTGHSDEPDATALQQVVAAFARRGVRLHLLRGQALPHANVVGYGPVPPECVAELAGQAFSGAPIVDFYQLKAEHLGASYNGRSFDAVQLQPVFHYALFAHRHSCDSTADCAKPACKNVDTGFNPVFNETGLAELPGNDLVVSLGGFRDRNTVPPEQAQGGTFMHELGHNLGLDHGGPRFDAGIATDPGQVALNFKPNYLSVMNYNHQTLGIDTAAGPGDTTPVANRLDYSSFCNPGEPPCSAGKHVPLALDEDSGDEAAGIELGTPGLPNNDIGYTWCNGVQTAIPGTGPVDFNCFNGSAETWCASGCDITPGLELNKDPAGHGQIPPGGDLLIPYEDWPNLSFAYQCASTFGDGASSGAALAGPELSVEQLLARHQLYPVRTVAIARAACGNAPGTDGAVVLYGARDFEIAGVDRSSLRLDGMAPAAAIERDCDGDGADDLLLMPDSLVRRGLPTSQPLRVSGWSGNGQMFVGRTR